MRPVGAEATGEDGVRKYIKYICNLIDYKTIYTMVTPGKCYVYKAHLL